MEAPVQESSICHQVSGHCRMSLGYLVILPALYRQTTLNTSRTCRYLKATWNYQWWSLNGHLIIFLILSQMQEYLQNQIAEATLCRSSRQGMVSSCLSQNCHVFRLSQGVFNHTLGIRWIDYNTVFFQFSATYFAHEDIMNSVRENYKVWILIATNGTARKISVQLIPDHNLALFVADSSVLGIDAELRLCAFIMTFCVFNLFQRSKIPLPIIFP